MMKKLMAILCCAALLFSLAGCSSNDAADFSNSTLTGQVVSVDGSIVTLQLGELTEEESQMEKPEGDNSGKPSGEPPAKPDGDSGGQPPAKPDGDNSGASSGPITVRPSANSRSQSMALIRSEE